MRIKNNSKKALLKMKRINNQSFKKVLITLIICGFPVFISGQAVSDGSMPQYLFNQFVSGTVRMKNSQVLTRLLNYNTVTEKMVFIKDEKYYDVTNPEMVDTIILGDCKFVPVGKSFYQVLYAGRTSLYVQNYSRLLQPGKPAGYGGTSQTSSTVSLSTISSEGMQWNLKLPSDYSVAPSPVYWIRSENEWHDFFTEKQFLKLFPEKAGLLKERIKTDKVKFDKPESLVRLIKYFNSL
jgi:hypothetical protein